MKKCAVRHDIEVEISMQGNYSVPYGTGYQALNHFSTHIKSLWDYLKSISYSS
jgi:hypothetical protein